MDANVVRTVNQGPMGPQGPVKVNHCIMNNDAGYKPVVRLFNLENIHYSGPIEVGGDPIIDTGEDIEDIDDDDTVAGGGDGPAISGDPVVPSTDEPIWG